MFRKIICNNQGMALAVVIMVFAVVSILGATALGLSLSQTKQSVASEDYTEAYYIARSATDVVSTNILNEVKAFYSLPVPKDGDDPNSESVKAYFTQKSKLDQILMTGNVVVTGVGNGPVNSYVNVTESGSPKKYAITVETQYTENGHTGTAKVQLGEITTTSKSIVLAGDAIYTWGNMIIGKSFNLAGDGGSVSYGGSLFDGKEDAKEEIEDGKIGNVIATKKAIDIDIIVPPSLPDKSGQKSLLFNNTRKITSADNGYYGDIDYDAIGHKGLLNWEIDTGTDPNNKVIIVVNSLINSNNGKGGSNITVTGKGTFELYLVENPSYPESPKTLMHFENKFNIDGTGDKGEPKTYIIAYTKAMQAAVAAGATSITHNIAPSHYDIVDIKNSSELDAYFYFPGVAFSVFQGSPNITGGIYASKFETGNSTTVTFKSYPPTGLLASKTDIGGEPKVVTKLEIKPGLNNLNKIWIK